MKKISTVLLMIVLAPIFFLILSAGILVNEVENYGVSQKMG